MIQKSTIYNILIIHALLYANLVSCHRSEGDNYKPGIAAETIINGPYLQQITSTSVIIRWRTWGVTDTVIKYGGSGFDYLQTITSPPALEHIVKISGLVSSTKYYYAVGDSESSLTGINDPSYAFSTSPVIGSKVPARIWVLGDSGTADANAIRVRNAYMNKYSIERDTNVLLLLGDNAYNSGTDVEYQSALFNIYGSVLRNVGVWPTLGNHDGISADSLNQSGVYYNIFSLPKNGEAGGMPSGTEAYYSFDFANIHFICLESNETDRSTTGAMISWLKDDLAATTQEWVVAYWHHPPYSKGSHDSDHEINLVEMRENVLPILEANGVDLVLTGHSHSYERSYFIDSHYGLSETFDPASMLLDGGSGKEDLDNVYFKAVGYGTAHEGTVYVVMGSSGLTSPGPLSHPVMYSSQLQLGSLAIDVYGGRMDVSFINDSGTVNDYFTLTKGPDTLPPTAINALVVNDTSVKISFAEQVDISSSENTSNYTISNGISVTGATLSTDKKYVLLGVSTMPAGSYSITIANIMDLSGNTMTSPLTLYLE